MGSLTVREANATVVGVTGGGGIGSLEEGLPQGTVSEDSNCGSQRMRNVRVWEFTA